MILRLLPGEQIPSASKISCRQMGFLVAASNIGPITLSKVWLVYRFKVHLAFLYTRQRPKPKMKSKWVQNHQQHETVKSTVCVIQQATPLCFPSPPKCLSLNGVQLGDPKDCSPPGSSVHGTHQARILEWVAIPFSRGSSWPRDQIQVSCVAGRFFTIWATWEAHRNTPQICSTFRSWE